MFHRSSFGRFGDRLPTDLDGFVPEPGDEPGDLRWGATVDWTPDLWRDFVAEAVAATEDASDALAKWRARR